MPRSRSICSLRLFRSLSERNISATQVLLQSNFSLGSRMAAACRTASRLTPHDLQNFNSSFWVEPHWGQNMSFAPSKVRRLIRRLSTSCSIDPGKKRIPDNRWEGRRLHVGRVAGYRGHDANAVVVRRREVSEVAAPRVVSATGKQTLPRKRQARVDPKDEEFA